MQHHFKRFRAILVAPSAILEWARAICPVRNVRKKPETDRENWRVAATIADAPQRKKIKRASKQVFWTCEWHTVRMAGISRGEGEGARWWEDKARRMNDAWIDEEGEGHGHPDHVRDRNEPHPASQQWLCKEVDDQEQGLVRRVHSKLASLLNATNRHVCTAAYCLRRIQGVLRCRYPLTGLQPLRGAPDPVALALLAGSSFRRRREPTTKPLSTARG